MGGRVVSGPKARSGRVSAPLRLTRRGRVVMRLAIGLLGSAVVATVVLLGGGAAMAGREAAVIPIDHHVVHSGESLWGIATQVAPQVDPRETVAQIVELNDLSGVQVRAGMRLAVPVAS